MTLIKNHKQERRIFRQRLFFLSIIALILLGLLVVRLFYLQIYNYKTYTLLSEHNQFEFLPIEPNRGLIYDRNGILLAENIPVFTLSIIPDRVKNLNTTLANLKKIITITPDNLSQFNRFYEQHRHSDHIPLKMKLTKEEIATFYSNQFRFSGVTVDATMIRHYPLNETMASVLGYVGRINVQDLKQIDNQNYSASHFIGKIGVEKNYEIQLHGKTGYEAVEVDAFGHILRVIKKVNPTPGNNLYLTIDSSLQKIAEAALAEENGAIVAVDPNNGEVLALVSHPSFDPNLFAAGIDTKTFDELLHSPDKPMFNRAIKGQFPFASTIKPFIALLGLDSNTINKNFTIYDPGWFKLPNSEHIYRDWVKYGHGKVDVTKAIIASCDTFFYTLAIKLGIEKIDEILTYFGFGGKTGIDLAEEQTGIVASPDWKLAHTGKPWYPGDTVISGIGQGFMTATPLQLALGVAAIATHGKRFEPHVLLKMTNSKEIATAEPTALTPVILNNPDNWDIVSNAMEKVINSPAGTAYSRFGKNYFYRVAGKTGTAQLYQHKIDENGDVIQMNIPKHLRNHSLFIAFAPVENPKIAIAVIAENATIAPQAARQVIDAYLKK